MSAGTRDDLITIERKTIVEDEYGGEDEAWATYATAWAQIFYGKGDERRSAAMEQGKQAVTFQVLANSKTRDVKLTDRITFGGSVYDIVGISPMDRAVVEFTAVRAL